MIDMVERDSPANYPCGRDWREFSLFDHVAVRAWLWNGKEVIINRIFWLFLYNIYIEENNMI
jgi:hypothetical protein